MKIQGEGWNLSKSDKTYLDSPLLAIGTAIAALGVAFA